MKPRPAAVQAALTLTMVLWGVSFVASKIILDALSPLTYMGLRFLMASVALLAVCLVRGFPRFAGRIHVRLALTALAEPVAYFLFESYGIRLLSPTTASLIIATIPLVVMVLAAVFLGEQFRPIFALAIAASFTGVGLVVSAGGQEHGAEHLLGVLLVVGAVLSAALYITQARALTQKHNPVDVTIIQTWWGALVFGLLWIAQAPEARAVTGFGFTFWAAMTFLALGATVAAFLLYNWALRHEGAGVAALYINAIPVVTAATSWLVLGERFRPVQIVGAALVLGSVQIAQRKGPTA